MGSVFLTSSNSSCPLLEEFEVSTWDDWLHWMKTNSTNWSLSCQPTKEPTNQPINQKTNQPTNQPTNKLINQAINTYSLHSNLHRKKKQRYMFIYMCILNIWVHSCYFPALLLLIIHTSMYQYCNIYFTHKLAVIIGICCNKNYIVVIAISQINH